MRLIYYSLTFFSSQGKRSKKDQNPDPHEEEYKKAPHSFVFHRGHVGRNIKQLALDTRMVMEPFTAKRLQVLFY